MAQPITTNRPWVGATAILLVILVSTGMFYYQYYALPATLVSQHIPEHVFIYLVAEQWAFKVNGTIDTRSTPIVVHVGDNVTFHIHGTWEKDPSFSQHGFFIQGIMDSPVIVSKGHDVTVSIVPTQPGEFTIICTVFCGAGHADMHGLLNVLP